jgi:anti-sigma regulatory factor (Ser/Thr protein kinase)
LSDQAAAGGRIRHVAWLYASGERLDGIRDFVAAGDLAGQPVLIAVPGGAMSLSWDVTGGKTDAQILDTADLGRNPARLMPLIRGFAAEHEGQDVRVVCELAWEGRSAPEMDEVARFELMLNLAFATTPITILCPYDVARLPGSAITVACDSHPWLRQGGIDRGNAEYQAPPDGPARPQPPLRVPADARALSYSRDLHPVRALVASEAARAGLSGPRRTDLVIAASEVAANTLKHTDGPGLVRIWVTAEEILCQFDDSGHITDPLAGYGRPAPDEPGGQGLWLVNQVCDLAEIRTSALGTAIRLHMLTDGPPVRLADRLSVGQPRLGPVGPGSS